MEEDLLKNKHFLMEVEQGIRLSNNEVIHQRMPPITSDRMLTFAVMVAKLRTEYIDAAFNFADAKYADGAEGDAEIDELRLRRIRFEEARDAFIALQRAIELGYMVVG